MRPADLTLVARTRADLASGRARAAREAAGVSVGEIAAATGVTHQAVSAWETGKRRPSADNALAYGKVLASVTRAAA